MRKGIILIALLLFTVSGGLALNGGEDDSHLSPLTGEVQVGQATKRPELDPIRWSSNSTLNGSAVGGGSMARMAPTSI